VAGEVEGSSVARRQLVEEVLPVAVERGARGVILRDHIEAKVAEYPRDCRRIAPRLLELRT
jgi:hypothetical protein